MPLAPQSRNSATTGEVQVFLYIAAWKPESCNTLPHPLAVKGKGCGFTEGVAT